MNEKMMIRSTDSIFLNSKSIFVEYIDIIKSPYFLFLYALMSAEDKVLKEPFDTEILKSLESIEALSEWYYCRHSQNPLIDLIPEENISFTNFDKVDEFMDLQLRESDVIIKGSSPLNFVNVINRLMTDSLLVPKVYIWYPYDNPNIGEDVRTLFKNEDIEFMHGNIGRCLKEIPQDSTYVFSDISNILVLEELNKLDMSSILIPVDFAYNLDEKKELLLDIDGLQKDHVFKINKFVATAE